MEHAALTGVLNKILSYDREKLPIITNEFEQTEFIEDLPAAEYHADKTRMSSSAIKKLLHSPRHFLSYWNGMEELEEEPDHFRIGRAAHMMLLEPKLFRESYVVEPIHQGLTKDGKPTTSANAASVQAAKAEWRAKQKPDALLVTEQELNDLIGMIEAVLEHPIASEMLQNGKPECSLRWTDRDTGIKCKARPDYVVNDKNGNLHLIDFKTTKDIRPGLFTNDIYRNRYFVQLAFYHDGLVNCLGKQPQTMTIIAAEKNAPYEVAVYPLSDKFFEMGQAAYRHALNTYKKCIDTGIWPAYSNQAMVLEPPNSANYDSLPEFKWEK